MRMFQDLFILVLMGLLLFFAISLNNDNSGSNSGTQDSSEKNNTHQREEQKIYWGVDSAPHADQQLQCVKDNFGKPDVWGRYLGSIKDVSQGLDEAEIDTLHENDMHILLIYNHFSEAVGYDHGVQQAEKAIDYASKLSVPDGVAIFGDIEPQYPVDAAFIQGWYETLADSKYHPGLYGVFDEDSALVTAYTAADSNTQNNTVVWTAAPQKGITTKNNAPAYKPEGPDTAPIYGWQYGIDSKACTIDTNLFKEDMLDYLW